MEYACKFRIYPNKTQEALINRTFGCCRYVFNRFLAERIEQYKNVGKTPTCYDQIKQLPILKKEYEWLKEADSTALQSAVENLDAAYKNFFRGARDGEKIGYPCYKSKHSNRQSYKSKQNIRVFDSAVQLPKLGKVKCRVSKKVSGRILSATVSRNPSGKYFVSICYAVVEMEPLAKTGAAVGIDLGLRSFAVTSDGAEYPNHKFLSQSEQKLAKLQRQLSRKSKGSKRYEKARVKVARLHEHIANQRNYMLHKLSTQFVRENDVICIEDHDLKSMIKDYRFAKSLFDASWGEFKRQLTYKTDWYGKQLVMVDRYFPSTQLCSNCGEQYEETKDLKVHKWICPACGARHDRDINAAKNILKEGSRISA